MGDNENSFVARFLENRITGGGVNRNHTQRIDALVNNILYDLNLLRRIGCRRPFLVGVNTRVGRVLLYAFIHTGKPTV